MQLPEKLILLQSYLQEHPETIDLYMPQGGIDLWDRLWTPDIRADFQGVGKTTTGSILSYWFPGKASKFWVWLDSEGVPMSVFARTDEAFLSLLHFDTGLIYEILMSHYFFRTDPIGRPDPLKKFSEAFVKKRMKEVNEISPDFPAFREWLVNDLDIKPAENPSALIVDAINTSPDLLTSILQRPAH